ncbi:MAG: PEP-CTERM system TPR-repeat protein PrsT [Colwellia sp.]|nr:PEP-CTERM system TPR-repeat protein PrsT [Colwellia sp.]MCW8865791.1 PEP-CTERM system TPR-repeat protein PrsT [Colwellia sp.]MCW9081811.1 PEP-CTERM system TPR-repeat protein PrsT [Colwellia sp.]
MNKTTIIASAVALAIGVSACSEQKSLEQLLASADEFSAKRDFGSAVIELKNAVRIAPKSAQARIALGEAYLEQGNFVFAEKELEKAQQLGIEQARVAPLLAQVKAKLAKPEAVYQLVETSGDLNDDDYIIVLTYAGIAALTQNERDKAQDYIGQAIAISETAVYSQVGKAYLAHSEQDYAQSLADIEGLLKDNPNLSEALLLKAHLLFSLGDYEQAAGSFASYLTQHPMDYSVRYFEINSLIKAELYGQAEVITDKLLAKFNKAPLALHYKAQLQYQKELYTEAKTNAEQAIQAGSNSAVTKLIAGASAYQLKDYEQAYNHLKPIESFLPNAHPIKKVLAAIKLQLGYNSEAAESFIALEGLTNADADFLQASTASLIEVGDFESAQKLIEKAEKLDPNSAQLQTQKGLVLLSQSNNEGIRSLERAIELDPSLTDVDLALGLQHLKANDINAAQRVADKLMSEHADIVAGYLLQGIIFSSSNKLDQASDMFNKALSIEPDNISSLFNLGLIKASLKQVDEAFDYFEKVLTNSPEHNGALFNMLQLAANNNQLARSEEFLAKIYDDKSLFLTLALAQNLRLNKKITEAVEILEALEDQSIANSQYWAILGDSYLQLSLFEKADMAFSNGLKLSPDNYFLNIRKIGALEVLAKDAEVLIQTRNAFSLFPNNERITILLAYYEIKNKNLAKAIEAFNIAKKNQFEHHLLDFVQGNIALSEKNIGLAIDSFSSAYDKKPSDENAMQLSRSLKFNGQQQEAEKVLESYLVTNSKDVRIRLLLAELYGTNNREKKIQQYLAIDEIAPNNEGILNNLAWNQYQVGQLENALATIKRAYNITPTNVTILESYGVILTANKVYDQAVEVLELAIAKGSQDKEVEMSLAKAKSALN